MDIQGEQIRFGVDAPEEVKVYCEEIYERMQAETELSKDAVWIALNFTWNEIMAKLEAVQTYHWKLKQGICWPSNAQIINEQLAELKCKIALTEE